MIEEEIKQEIIDIMHENRYYISTKEFCKLLLEIVDDINFMKDETINSEIQDITDYAINYVSNRVKLVLDRYYINKINKHYIRKTTE